MALVVDDNEINRKIMDVILCQAGAVAAHAVDGREAVSAFASEDFDVVLMDIQMPVMDGFMATRAIRAIEARRRMPRTPVIMVSAFTSMKDIDASIDAGADLHLGKPVQVNALLAVVQDALDGWPSRLEGRQLLYYP